MDELIEKIKKARFVWICGNGGSASTAEHFTNDLFKKGYKAICLSSNVSVMTMLANDEGYEQVFNSQLEVYADPKIDLLITISCSGMSRNIANAAFWAKIEGLKTYQFETFGEETDYGKLEDKHLKFAHEVASRL